MGRPEDLMEDLALSVRTPQKLKEKITESETNPTDEAEKSATNAPMQETHSSTPVQNDASMSGPSSSTPTISTPDDTAVCRCLNCQRLGPEPHAIPGKVFVPVWSVQDPPPANRSFD